MKPRVTLRFASKRTKLIDLASSVDLQPNGVTNVLLKYSDVGRLQSFNKVTIFPSDDDEDGSRDDDRRETGNPARKRCRSHRNWFLSL